MTFLPSSIHQKHQQTETNKQAKNYAAFVITVQLEYLPLHNWFRRKEQIFRTLLRSGQGIGLESSEYAQEGH